MRLQLSSYLTTIAACLACATASAGGFSTNTNQNPIFYRQPAQNAVVGIQGAYYNPAGLALMDKGWHFSVGTQLVIQSRTITSDYAPFAYDATNGGVTTKKFRGETLAPFVPNIDAAYSSGRWAASFHFGVVSGGGSVTFDDGLGSFEAPYALLPAAINGIAGSSILNAYDTDIRFKGESYGFGGQLNFSYKVLDRGKHHLSLAAGLRVNYYRNAYDGSIQSYMLGYGGSLQPATPVLSSVLKGMGIPETTADAIAERLGGDQQVECNQKAWGLTPVLSLHYRYGIWDVAARYEFRTSVRLKNSTPVNTVGIEQFEDGKEIAADVPALLSVGAGVSILPVLRASAGYNYYFDKDAYTYNSATGENDKQELWGSNTWEFLFGMEWDTCRIFTLSAGVQVTRYDFGQNAAFISDMNFQTSSVSVGGGGRFNIGKHFAIDVSVFNVFYETLDKTYEDYGGAGSRYASVLKGIVPDEKLAGLKIPGKDSFTRSTLSFGLGLVMKF